MLEDQASQDSKNSNKPPSGDGFKQRTQSLRTKSRRKSGGQPGHPGSPLEWVNEPDEIEQHLIDTCQSCGASLVNRPIVEWQCAQVHDLIPIEIVVREHQAAVKQCGCCGQIDTGLRLNPANPPLAKSRGCPKQTPARNLLERLDIHQAEVLRFIHNFQVPFDHNQAERDIRMMKLKQKISGGFCSEQGAQIFCRIRGYLSTLKKQGHNLLDTLERVFLGQPISLNLQPE